MWQFYDGDSPILLGERELSWPKIICKSILRSGILIHGYFSASLCILQLFFPRPAHSCSGLGREMGGM